MQPGDFAAYLIERGVEFERYVGVDALAEVVAYAAERGMSGCEFHAGDLMRDASLFAIGRPQVVCISGTLNTMTDGQALQVLGSAWEATEETLMFNFLSGRSARRAPRQTGPARRLDPLWLLNWAFERTAAVEYRQDYFPHGHDGTLLMRKEV